MIKKDELTRTSDVPRDSTAELPPVVAPRVLDRKNAAVYLGISLRTLDEYIAMRLIPRIAYPGTVEKPSKSNGLRKPRIRSSHRIGFWIKHLDEFLTNHTVGGADG